MWIHSLESGKSTPVQGSTGTSYPFWSPNGRFIAFFADGKLKKVPAAGGPVEVLCDAASGRGGSWNEAGTIIFTPTSRSPIYSVSSTGGKPKPVTTLRNDERAHRFPSFLPDGKRFLYAVGSDIADGHPRLELGDMESGRSTTVAQNASSGQYVAPGFLMFVRNGALLAARFDSRSGSLTGEPIVVAPSVGYHPAKNLGMFTAGGNGTVAFIPLYFEETEFRMVDRTGRVDAVVTDAAVYQMGDLSSDGQRVAATRLDPTHVERADLWVTDLATRRGRRVSSDQYGFVDVRWTPDGKRVLVTGGTHAILDIFSHDLAGKSEVLVESALFKRHPDLSPDGKSIVYAESNPQTQWDIKVMSLQPPKPPVTFVATPGPDGAARFSTDGRFIAYMSAGDGAPEIYVKRLPDTGEQWQISTGGGLWPRWSPNGRELYYEQPGGMLMSVAVETKTSFDAGAPKPLFQLPRGVNTDSPVLSGVTPDGKRFLVAGTTRPNEKTGFYVILDWQVGLAK